MMNHLVPKRRRAVTAVFVLVSLPVLLGMGALVLDVGVLYNTRADLQNTADSASMAAIAVIANPNGLADPMASAIQTANDYMALNPVMGHVLALDPASDILFGHAVFDELTNSYSFTPGDAPTNAVQINVRQTADSPNGSTNLYFASVFGLAATDVSASSIAMFVAERYQERDCNYAPPAGKTLMCAPGVKCDGGTDSGKDSEDCFGADSESGPAKGSHTIEVNVASVSSWLQKGASVGPCACIAGDPDDSDDSEAGDSFDSDDSSAAGGGATSDKTLICHTSLKQSNVQVTMSVSPADLVLHQAHGDTVGACAGTGTIRILLIR